ncbi:MAG: hypothetical protein NC177_13990 [Ruminococcus flavefaciens]|nr:hypothetical protein [Ruminococcus flavefaciens]
MSFYIDTSKNNGYPYIEGLPEMPDSRLKKPYFRYFFIVDNKKNNGYPSFEQSDDMPAVSMRKIYPHGIMMCMGDSVNDGYPCIPEISNVGIKKYSSLYFGDSHISEIFYNDKYISTAYCNENEVFSIKYINN